MGDLSGEAKVMDVNLSDTDANVINPAKEDGNLLSVKNQADKLIFEEDDLKSLADGKSTGDYYPNGMPEETFALGAKAPIQLDGDGTNQIRGSVLTDEGSYSDHFADDILSADWEQVIGDGGSVSVFDSLVHVESGVTPNSETYIQIPLDYLPLHTSFSFSISQRIANQDIYICLADGDSPINDVQFARLHFYGTDNTKVSAETQVHLGTGGSEGIDTQLTLPYGNTGSLLDFFISIIPEKVAFSSGYSSDTVENFCVKYSCIPTAYQSLNLRIRIKNGAIAPASSTCVCVDKINVRNLNRISVENPFLNDAAAVQIVGYDVGSLATRRVGVDAAGNLKIVSKSPSGSIMLQLLSEGTLSSIAANQWQDILIYTVPSNYDFSTISFQGNTASAGDIIRVAERILFGTFDTNTGVFVNGLAWTTPKFSASLSLLVTTTIGAVGADTIIVTYTNQAGIAGRTASLSIPKSTVAGTRLVFTLQAGDYGVRDITNITHTQVQTGAVTIEGYSSLMYLILDSANTLYSQSLNLGSSVIVQGESIVLQFQSSSTVAKQRRICLVGLLAPR